jgi:hypothetical protein
MKNQHKTIKPPGRMFGMYQGHEVECLELAQYTAAGPMIKISDNGNITWICCNDIKHTRHEKKV